MNLFKKKFRNIKKLPSWFYFFPAVLLRFLKLIMRVDIIDPFYNLHSKENVIFLIWHNRLLFCPLLFSKRIQESTYAMISPSRDGQYISDMIAQFNVKSIRGSSSKKGGKVLLQAIKLVQEGYNLAITPDGPRGPIYKMSPGAIQIASITGKPIIPLAIVSSNYWELKSWDKFQIPKPWGRLALFVGDKIYVPPDLSDKEFKVYLNKIEETLQKLAGVYNDEK